jgi:hypothetical protein
VTIGAENVGGNLQRRNPKHVNQLGLQSSALRLGEVHVRESLGLSVLV